MDSNKREGPTFAEFVGDMVHGDITTAEEPEEVDEPEASGDGDSAPADDAPDTRPEDPSAEASEPASADDEEVAPSPEDDEAPSPEAADNREADPSDDTTEDADREEVPDTRAEAEPAEDDDADDVTPSPEAEAEAAADDADEEVAEPVYEIDGEQVTLEELRKGYLRQEDYSRKTQELARQREQVQQTIAARQQLAQQISAHDGLQKFLSDNPEAYELLLNNPRDTQRLMQNPEELKAFTADYEVLATNPRVAEAYVRAEDEGQATQQLRQQRQAQQYVNFANELDSAIDRVAQREDYADAITEEDIDEVKSYVMELGGFTPDMVESQPQAILQGLNRLATVFVTPDGQQLDMKLVLDRFDAIKQQRAREAAREEKSQEEHNQQVDAELAEQNGRTPKTPSGDGAAPAPDRVQKHEDFAEVLGTLSGHQ